MALTPLAGCSDLDTVPQGQYATAEQKGEVTEKNPERAQAAITGITALFSTYCQIYDRHNDFGIPSYMLYYDQRGQDMVGLDIGYNWFTASLYLNDCNGSSYLSNYAWRYFYRQLQAVNAALGALDQESENPELQFYVAQALAMRAYDYFELIQNFQFTYVGNEDKPGVMLITEKNADEAAANGIERASVRDTYALIMSDINKAIELLENCGIEPSDVLDSAPKRFLSLAAAYGLRARINLVMNNWEAAADDAQAAIDNFSGRPMSFDTAAKPCLSSIDESCWMWGISIAPTDRVVTSGIVNWISHMGSWNYGYAQVGAYRLCNVALYNSIPATDARKNWFVNSNGECPNLSADRQAYVAEYELPPYCQVKFDSYQGVLDQSENANDVPLMRIEEMYLILAEATAMNGGDGASILTNFVKAYRDPAYSFSGSGQAVQDECWRQRRIELWGEGISYHDLMRLNKGINRIGGGFEEDYVYKIDPTDQILVMVIPESEENGNKKFSAADNNPAVGMPTPVADVAY